jgi:hypothetical protein
MPSINAAICFFSFLASSALRAIPGVTFVNLIVMLSPSFKSQHPSATCSAHNVTVAIVVSTSEMPRRRFSPMASG